jgi:hypothetical protein
VSSACTEPFVLPRHSLMRGDGRLVLGSHAWEFNANPFENLPHAYVFWCLKLEPSVVYTDYTDSVSMPLQGTQRWRDCHAFSLESLWVELLL